MGRLSRALGALLAVLLGTTATASTQDRTPSRIFLDDWSEGRVRPFFAFAAAAGSTSQTSVAVGYGKPYWTYVALESEGLATPDFAMTRVRARLALVVADLSVAWGRAWAYRHTLLPRTERYRDLTLSDAPRARYDTLQVSLAGFIPAPGGYVDWQAEAIRIHGVEGERAVYEEQLRMVVFPPWAVVGRLGYAYQLAQKRAALGVLAEALWPGGRDAFAVRVGPTLSWAFSPRLDAAATVTTVVHSPDGLGIYEDLWGNVRVRYRTASR